MNDQTIPSNPDYTLDLCGLFCPEPVMMLHNKIRDIVMGETIEVWATDPATKRDIPKFCQFLGHTLLSQEEREGKYIYVLQKCGDSE